MCRNKIIEACVPESARDWAVARLSARDAGWDEILGRAQTLPMLAPRQVIVVEEAESVEKLGEKARDEVLEMLGKYFESPAPFTVLLLEAAALDGRQRFFKLLSEKALIVELTIGAGIGRGAGHADGQGPRRGNRSRSRGTAGRHPERRARANAHRARKTGHLRARARSHHRRRCRSAGGGGAQEYGLAA